MENKSARKNLFHSFLGRHIVVAVSVFLLILYYVLRGFRPVADFATTYIMLPWHRLSGGLTGFLPFSAAEWLCALIVAGLLVYLGIGVYRIVRRGEKLKRLYGMLMAVLAAVLMLSALICWLWSIGFYSATYTESSGITVEEVSIEELKETTEFFVEEVNRAAGEVERDSDGVFICDIQRVLTQSPALYHGLPERFTFLEGSDIPPKPLVFSVVLSHMNFSGGFFPFTGEANINVHAPQCFIPATVAHELAHQRGVVREQDTDFTAIMVCLESDSSDFRYSGALLAYLRLANALREVSYDDWVEVADGLDERVRTDLTANNDYWADFSSPAADISETAYDGFLKSQGQELGMKSYGACVDLLVAYYGETE